MSKSYNLGIYQRGNCVRQGFDKNKKNTKMQKVSKLKKLPKARKAQADCGVRFLSKHCLT